MDLLMGFGIAGIALAGLNPINPDGGAVCQLHALS